MGQWLGGGECGNPSVPPMFSAIVAPDDICEPMTAVIYEVIGETTDAEVWMSSGGGGCTSMGPQTDLYSIEGPVDPTIFASGERVID